MNLHFNRIAETRVETRGKSASRAAIFFAILLTAGGCRQRSDAEAIRAGIREHLVALKTLDLNAMDINVANVAIHGNQAEAQAEFRPKTGAPAGAEMRVSYVLEKRDGNWVVLKTQAVGGVIEHPAPGANPHQSDQPNALHGLPNFRDILPPNPDSTPPLPPGHPPVNPSPAPRDSTASKKKS